MQVLQQIRAVSGDGTKIALLWDNCKIHQANIVKELATTAEIDIELVFNVAYRPDLMGIELFWAESKRRYRRELDRLKAHNRNWDQ